MKILWIDIDGFGKLVERRFEFGSALNLIFGENEAGKTTLLQAIVSLLFGKSRGRSSPAALDLSGYRPWGQRRFGGALSFELDDGRRYVIKRDFRRGGRTRLTSDNGTPAPRKKIPPVPELLGISRNVFASCALVNHNSIMKLAKPGELSEAILRAAGTQQVESSAENAAARLHAARHSLGEATDAETPRGRLENEIDDLLARKASAAAQQRTLLQLLSKRHRLEDRLEQYRRQVAEVELAMVVRRHRDASQRLRDILEAERHLDEQHHELASCEPFASLPADGREKVAQAWQGLDQTRQELAALEETQRQIERQIAAAEEKLQKMQETMYLCQPGDYDYFAESRAAWLAAVKRLHRYADEARQYEERMRERGLSPEHLRALSRFSEAEFKRLEEKEEEFQRWHRRMTGLQEDVLRLRAEHPFPASLKVTLAVATLFFSGVNFLIWYLQHLAWGWMVGGASLAAVGLLSVFLSVRESAHRRQLRRLESELSEAHERAYRLDREVLDGLQVYGARSLTDLLSRRIEFLEAGSMFREVQIAQDDQHRLEERLVRLLRPLAVDKIDEDMLAEISERVEETRRCRAELNSLLDQRDQIRRRLLTAELEARRHRTTIQKALAAAGIQEHDGLDERAALEEVFARRDRYDELRREVASSEKLLAGLLGGRTRQEWEEITASLERRVNKLLNALNGTQEIPDLPARRLEHRYDRLRKLIAQVEAELAAIRERVTSAVALAEPLAEIEEAIAWRQKTAAALRRHSSALDLAQRELQAAVDEHHRDFAPRLAAAVSRHLPMLTGSRYTQAVLDPRDFSLGLLVPQRGFQPAERLSLGTREQLYLLLRIAIADTLGTPGETLPLLLDDPFVHFDAPRLASMLSFLVSLASTRQVLLFTKDVHARNLLQEQLTPSAEARYIELTL